MSETIDQQPVNDAETPEFPVDLRTLIRHRTETKARRIHRQWFCFDPDVQAEVDESFAALAELTGAEIQKQALQQSTSKKYGLPSPIRVAQARYDEAKARSYQVGAMGVFQNLNDEQIEAAKKVTGGSFERAKFILTTAFLRWEDADGNLLPSEVLGREDLETLIEPEVLEQGEWLPLTGKIINESTSVIDRPTLPTP